MIIIQLKHVKVDFIRFLSATFMFLKGKHLSMFYKLNEHVG